MYSRTYASYERGDKISRAVVHFKGLCLKISFLDSQSLQWTVTQRKRSRKKGTFLMITTNLIQRKKKCGHKNTDNSLKGCAGSNNMCSSDRKCSNG